MSKSMPDTFFDLSGKSAIITGSTRGIGRAIALAMARAGANVVISSRKERSCNETASEFIREGLTAIPIPCHVGETEQIQNLVEQTIAAYGRLDILVCNAATNPVHGPMHEVPESAFDKVMAVNLRSVFQLCNLACPLMKEHGGSIIVISSIAALRGSGQLGVYGISKAAECALVRNLAVEWGPYGIRANAIAPGLVRTQFSQQLTSDPARLERVESRTPLRRIGEPEDISGVAVFLASRAAAYITGQVIVADGGEIIA
jgi:dehydrogenase/reductase SDR family member 4